MIEFVFASEESGWFRVTGNPEVIDMKAYSGKTATSSDFTDSFEIGLAMSRCGRRRPPTWHASSPLLFSMFPAV